MMALFIIGCLGIVLLASALVVDLSAAPGPMYWRRIAIRDVLCIAGIFLAVGSFALAGAVAFIHTFGS